MAHQMNNGTGRLYSPDSGEVKRVCHLSSRGHEEDKEKKSRENRRDPSRSSPSVSASFLTPTDRSCLATVTLPTSPPPRHPAPLHRSLASSLFPIPVHRLKPHARPLEIILLGEARGAKFFERLLNCEALPGLIDTLVSVRRVAFVIIRFFRTGVARKKREKCLATQDEPRRFGRH
jgi:hypothetical protein